MPSARNAPFADMIEGEVAPGAAVQDRAAVDATLAASVLTYQHPTSTVPMGGSKNPKAAVDIVGRVRGVTGLRVVDASTWPDVPSVATACPTIMMAERIASTIAFSAASTSVTPSRRKTIRSHRIVRSKLDQFWSALRRDTSSPSRCPGALPRSNTGPVS